MIRVLYLPLNSHEIVQTGMYDAFKAAGCELKVFDFNRSNIRPGDIQGELLKVAKEFKPHLVHMQLQFTTNIVPDTILKIKKALPNTIITNWTGDVRAKPQSVFCNMAKAVDISLVSSSGQVDMYKRASGNQDIRYWQIGFDPAKYFEKNKNSGWKYDVSFAASNHTKAGFPGHAARKKTVDLLHRQFKNRFGLFGIGWKKYRAKYMPQAKMNDVYNDSLCCISVSNFNDLGHYFSDRLLMCMASGRPVISFRFPGWEDYFVNNHDIVIADSIEDIPKKVHWLKSNPDIANAIGAAGAAKVQAEHSYHSKVEELLHMVGLK